ncbi:WG repeat-containing protein [Bacteroides acidifaciens]|uniref:WG repeat-containing protein n=1 Tax=Bacteroides acidifaciens TaxID=85831 RepID=UPI0026F07865|nr:WG repeat-containing protein [Bacteroides acidifaciens]
MYRFCILLISIIIGLEIDAQELMVKSFERSLNPMTVPMQKKDLNGFVCSLVKIQLPINGVKFEGNIIASQFDVNEYFVYLSPNSKMIAIKCPGYKTLKVYFNDYQVPSLVSKNIYILDIQIYTYTNNEVSTERDSANGQNEDNNKSGDEEIWTVFFDEKQKAGFGNSNGEVFIPAQFEDARSFSEGLAGIKIDGRWGFIDKTGTVVIPCAYDKVSLFKNGNSVVDESCIEDGKQRTRQYLIDYTGKRITSLYDEIDFFRDNRALIKINDKYGFVDRHGSEVIPPVYDSALCYSDGYAAIRYNGKWGVIDMDGKEVINAEYNEIEPSDYNLVAVLKNGKWGYLNMNGERITKFEFDDADAFDGCEYTYVEKNDLCGMIDTIGRLIIPVKYDELDLLENKEGLDYTFTRLIRANKNDKYGIINLKNKTVVPFKYDYLDFVESNGLIRANLGDKWGYVNNKGDVVVELKYEAVEDFCDGIGLVKKDGKWGGVNTNGEVVFPFIYESHNRAPYGNNNGLYTLRLNGKWGCLNSKGSIQIPFKYDAFGYFTNGRVKVKLGSQEYLINENGKRVSEVHPSDPYWP